MGNIGVIGAGIWGTALALTASRADNNVLCWARRKSVVDNINEFHINSDYLGDVILPNNINATDNIANVFDFSDVILLTVSAQNTRSVLKLSKPFIKKDTIIVFCAKGLEVDSGKMLSEIASEEIPDTTIAILSGPGFAVDVAEKRFASVTIACKNEDIAKYLTKLLSTPYFRPYYTTDIISPQIGGSIKNVIAIASGIIEGAKLGDGARAALICRGFNEMTRLSKILGGQESTMMGMCGLGDLVLTANCIQSRNFSFGRDIGIYKEAKKVIEENTRTVEGLYTTRAVIKLAKSLSIEMPICEMLYRILYENVLLEDAINELLSRPNKIEGIKI